MSWPKSTTGIPATTHAKPGSTPASSDATYAPSEIPWTPITDQQRNSTSAIRLMCSLSVLCGGMSKMTIETPEGPAAYGISELAKRQFADKLPIPYAYFERMRNNHPSLLDENLKTWLHGDPDRRLVRTLDGRVRALLPDRYRRLDNN